MLGAASVFICSARRQSQVQLDTDSHNERSSCVTLSLSSSSCIGLGSFVVHLSLAIGWNGEICIGAIWCLLMSPQFVILWTIEIV